MKKSYKYIAIITVALTLSVFLCSPITVSAWRDSDGDRETYSLQQVSEGVLGDKITFNSISIKDSDYDWYKNVTGKDLPSYTITEEANYVGARLLSNTGYWNGNNITVEDGKIYVIRIYAHNNNPDGKNAVAKDTKVSFEIPEESGTQIQVKGHITSSNASPAKYIDQVNFNSDKKFHLEYVNGSALLENNGIGAGDGVQLSDGVVKSWESGILIGYDALDGNVPGGYEYDNYVTIEVKAVFDPEYTVQTKVRKVGEETWQESLEVEVGDKVEYQIEYQNTSDIKQGKIVIRDVLPSNLKYVAGSTKLYNSSNPTGVTIDQDTVVTEGITTGYYGSDSNAIVRFTAEVVDENLAYGKNTLVNWGRVSIGEQVVQDKAEVIVHKTSTIIVIITILVVLIVILIISILILYKKLRLLKKTQA